MLTIRSVVNKQLAACVQLKDPKAMVGVAIIILKIIVSLKCITQILIMSNICECQQNVRCNEGKAVWILHKPAVTDVPHGV